MKNNKNFIKKWKKCCNSDPRNFLIKNLWENSLYQSLRDDINIDPRLRSTLYCTNLMEKYYVNILDPLIKSNNYDFINELIKFVSSIFNSKAEEFIFDQYIADKIDFYPSETENDYYHFMNLISILVKNYKMKIPMKFYNAICGKINFNIIGIDKGSLIKMINMLTPSQIKNIDDGIYNLFNSFRSSINDKGMYICSSISSLNMEKTEYTSWQLFCSERMMISSEYNSHLLLITLISSYVAIFMDLSSRLYDCDKIKMLSLICEDEMDFKLVADLISIIIHSKILISNNIDPFELNINYSDMIDISDLKRFIFDENIKELYLDSDISTFYNNELGLISIKL